MSKVAFITGGSRGIGLACAHKLAREGWDIVIAAKTVEPHPKLEGTIYTAAEEIEAAGGKALPVVVDIRSEELVRAAVDKAVETYGGIDIPVNNAGIMDRMPFLDMTPEFWDRVHGINLRGAFLCGQAAARAMVTQGRGGRIVNVASNSGIFGGRGRAAYGASKAGLINLTQTMAIELAEHRINVNAVAPGPTKTGPHMPDEPWPSVKNRMPLGRFGAPEEIAAVAAFLASDEASFVTGHTYGADGGYTVAGIMEG